MRRDAESYMFAGGVVVLPARAAATLATLIPREHLLRLRLSDPDMYEALAAVRLAGLQLGTIGGGSGSRTSRAARAEPAQESDQRLGVDGAAKVIRISTVAVRKALREKRLAGEQVDGRWIIHRRDAEQYRDNRTG